MHALKSYQSLKPYLKANRIPELEQMTPLIDNKRLTNMCLRITNQNIRIVG